ncbi:MAG: AzlC family ABC transporter permease [Acidimicrobiia bacterium]|nr:AzlC family ABC transporter permease [Acidimicrobiia bacterium]
MSTAARKIYRQAVHDFAPLILGIIPFGIIAGIAAIEAGLSISQAMGFSTIVLAGAAQLASIALLGQNATLVIVVATALIINARFLMYSASLAPHFAGLSLPRRMLAAYLLTDQAYAFSISRYRDEPWDAHERLRYYVGIGASLWVVWQISTAIGAVLGAGVPEEWSLDFAVPLVFLAILVPAIRDKADGTAALIAGLLAVTTAGLPYNLALLAAALAGIFAGVAFERAATK